MKRNSPSFLDLTALAEVGALLLDPRAAWLWLADGTRILWANPAGIRYFGDTSAQKVLERRFPKSHPIALQIAALAPTLKIGEPQMTLLRLPSPTDTEAHLAVATRLAIGEDEDAIIIASQQRPGAVEPLAGRAFALASAIAEDGMIAAILRPDGTLVASSGEQDFEAVLPTLAGLIATSSDGRRVLKRRVPFGRARRIVGITNVGTPEGSFRLALIGPSEPLQVSAELSESEISHPVPNIAAPGVVDHEVSGFPGSNTPPVPATAPAPGQFVFAVRATPVRFAYQLDAEHRFTQVSPELAALVGPRSADIVGLSWNSVARAFHLGAAETVERLLARRDTWSGVSVYWPIQDSADAVAIDLGALPTFNRAGTFEGFRGFGVCRTNDVRPFADGRDASPADAAPTAADEPTAERSNVVRLAIMGAPRERSLNGTEEDAFSRVSNAVRADSRKNLDPDVGARSFSSATTDAASAASDATALRGDTPALGLAALREASSEPVIPMRFLDRVPLGVLVFRDRSILFANRALWTRLRYTSGASLIEAGTDLLLSNVTESDHNAEQLRQIRLQAADGEDVVLNAKLHVVPWTDGSATMLSAHLEADPVPSLAPPAALSAALSRIEELEAVLDTATDGVIVLDGDGRIESLNQSAEALFGVAAAAVVGRSFLTLLAEESRHAALDYFEGLTNSRVASVLNDGRDVIGLVPSGGLIPLFMTMGRLADHGRFCAVLRDMTQWKAVEAALIGARRSAEVANRQKSDFLALVSHEIRTPLNTILGFSEVILEERFGSIGSERYREYVRDIRLSGEHLMSLVNDLLDLAKIEAGKVDLDFAEVAVNDILQECVALMQPEANRSRVIIRTSLSAASPVVIADQRSLRQIVLNLLSNAVKFTLAGGHVIVSALLDNNGEVAIRIRDTGIGMSEADLQTALKPFQQVTMTKRGCSDGTGLGLPLTKALVEANQASFNIDSSPNQGTMARVTFPAARVLLS